MSTGLQLFSTVNSDATLILSLGEQETPTTAADEVVIRVEAAPLNPSDMATLFAAADLSTASAGENEGLPVVTATIPDVAMPRFQTRVGMPVPVGNEGAGVVVAAGDAAGAQALLNKTVSIAGGSMYGQYRCVKFHQCMPMPDDITPKQAASSFVNPMTALGFVATMRKEGHKALINTAAASNLGQMLNRICQADGIDLVNVVRKEDQAQLLRDMGAKYVVNSSAETFRKDLAEAIEATGATIAFDAIGGGKMVNELLSAMEIVAAKQMNYYDHYGSRVRKQVYIYGGLDLSPTPLYRNYGFAWNVGGWLLTNFLMEAGGETVKAMRERIASEITTTFATHYTDEISLREALELEHLLEYSQQATGKKYLINPQL